MGPTEIIEIDQQLPSTLQFSKISKYKRKMDKAIIPSKNSKVCYILFHFIE